MTDGRRTGVESMSLLPKVPSSNRDPCAEPSFAFAQKINDRLTAQLGQSVRPSGISDFKNTI